MLEIVDYISEFVDLPPLRLPDLDLPADPTLISSAEIEHAAEITRSFWGLHPSPIGNLLGLLESNGIITGCWALGADTLDSLSHFSASLGRPIIIVGSEKTAAVRQRFDAAHELGHMILHKSFKGEPDSALHKLMEDQAHRYAGAFLLPMSSFMDDVFAISLDALLSLKPKWRTSVGVMIKRLLQTELIEADQEQRLWINYSRRRWRSMEPYDDKLEPEEPGLIKRALEVMVHEGVQGRDDILATLDLDVSDIEDLAALPSGFFNAPAPTLTLRPKASKFDRDVGTVGLADVVQMRKGESPPRIEPA
jgi:Zn-dependent peptidase ImmA (M78 family)